MIVRLARTTVLLLLLAACRDAAAEESPSLPLMRPDSLVGWDYGKQPIRGWETAEGRLSGSTGATPLLSGWTFGDFVLNFRWSVEDGGAWEIGLPLVADLGQGREFFWRLQEGADGGVIRSQWHEAFAGSSIERSADGWHTAEIRRTGEKLSLYVDGKLLRETKIPNEARFGLGVSLASGKGSLADLRIQEPPGEEIFNRRDLTGWWTPGNRDSWVVENGELVCINKEGNYLRTEKEYGNYTLALEYQMARGGNSGIGIRTPRNGWPSGDGMELQMYDQPGLDGGANMSLYRNLEPLARADKSKEWNHVVIKADGRIISAWVNGQLVQHGDTSQLPELKHRHLSGWIGFQDHGARTRFRNIRLLAAPAGLGLPEWQNRPESPAQVVLDRLMNSDRLAVPDAIAGDEVHGKIASSDEQVLAELNGPGAVTRVWMSQPGGRLSLYFDGEETPRINCPAEQLHEHVPALGEDRQPLFTWIPYKSSLRVVAEGGSGANFALSFVRSADAATDSPAFSALESSARKSGLPRGMAAAVDYRLHQLGWGTHRENDPYSRAGGEAKRITPGSSVPLVSVDGAGTVLWFKLQADPQVLTNSDLWLDVTVDGESSPAISAPARYLFPILLGGNNRPNYVMTNRGGMTSLLAMPFAEGLSISARNAGQQPIAGVAATVSVDRGQPSSGQEMDRRMRLRGVFQRGGSTSLIERAGSGRWVGLVYQPTSTEDGIASLIIDGRPRSDWSETTLKAFLGQPSGEQEFFRSLSGRSGGLAWRYLLTDAISFEKSLVIQLDDGRSAGERLALFYMRP